MSDSLVSVIVPVYNAENYLKETIESVLIQSYNNIELILVNHNATDTSEAIIQAYVKQDTRVKSIFLPINKGGPAYPRNEGLKIANGKYIAFLDADDVWLKSKLEEQMVLIQESGADMVHTLANKIDENSKIQGDFKNQRVHKRLQYILNEKNIIFYTNYININSVLLKKSDSIIFSEDINLVAMEDWNLWMQYISSGKKVILLEKKLLNYRVHSSSISNRGSDIGYRKSLYLLSLVFLGKAIPMRHYMMSSLAVCAKILIKNLRG